MPAAAVVVRLRTTASPVAVAAAVGARAGGEDRHLLTVGGVGYLQNLSVAHYGGCCWRRQGREEEEDSDELLDEREQNRKEEEEGVDAVQN